jgi:death-on-curing protein
MRAKPISLAEVEYVALQMAQQFMTWNGPIPEFSSRFPHILESCIGAPFGRFGRKELYKGYVGKGSILFYLLIKNHPFRNGNKRIVIMCLLYFLHKNGKWIHVSNEKLYRFAKHVAASRPQKKEPILADIQRFLAANIKDLTYRDK